ncbi:MAG: DUF5343 domain-containing protein [Terracidiphilus sp.]
MATTSTQPQNGELIPPYVPFTTFQSAIDNLRTHGLPDPIDKTTWDSRSGSDQIQIFAALRFLRLLGDGDHPTAALRSLVDAKPNTPEEKAVLRELIRSQYSEMLKQIDLNTATPGQLEDAIGSYQLKGSTKDRAIRFFLKAATYCGIGLSSRLTRNMRERASLPSASGAEEQSGEATPAPVTPPNPRKRRKKTASGGVPVGSAGSQSPIPEMPAGNAMKTVSLPNVKGTLTISGTFNAFGLSGEERKLVYDIIDMMNIFEAKLETEK